jgi:hypothetical protein
MARLRKPGGGPIGLYVTSLQKTAVPLARTAINLIAVVVFIGMIALTENLILRMALVLAACSATMWAVWNGYRVWLARRGVSA